MQLYLIRHPAPAVAPGLCYGRTDLAPADDPAAAAARLAAHLPGGLPVFTSPLQRCLRLAQALSAAPRADPRLSELDFGRWEMTPWQAIGRAALDAWAADPLDYAGHGGETVRALRQRALEFVAATQAAGVRRAVVVTHAGIIKALAGAAGALPERDWMALAFACESVTEVRFDAASGG